MNLYTSLTLRYLKENKKRTIVTIVSILSNKTNYRQ